MDEETKRRKLLLRLLDKSPYRRKLLEQEEDIARVALANANIRQALDRILNDPDYASSGKIHRRRLAAPLATINHLYEWVFFASDSFVERARRG